ncbi:MAG: crotonase/enoyl-CoA hydratase family protein [Thioalkalispiraceae bacterium]|jgi:DSF synthase
MYTDDVTTQNSSFADYLADDYQALSFEYHPQSRSLWFYMQAKPRPCFTPALLHDLQTLFDKIDRYPDHPHPVEYLIAASGMKGIYNLGGDLSNFLQCIKNGNRDFLQSYAYSCLELGYRCYQQFDRGITSIALIDGNAYGGGFEAALSCNILIAEENVEISFPEINFNLFPGMGAYSYLSRRAAPHIVEEMITSGRPYTGKELFDLGIIDICAKPGEGHQAAMEFLTRHRRQQHGRIAMHRARQAVYPVTMPELMQVADVWVDAAIGLDKRGLKVMERFSNAQQKREYETATDKMEFLVA